MRSAKLEVPLVEARTALLREHFAAPARSDISVLLHRRGRSPTVNCRRDLSSPGHGDAIHLGVLHVSDLFRAVRFAVSLCHGAVTILLLTATAPPHLGLRRHIPH